MRNPWSCIPRRAQTRPPVPAQPGAVERRDYEYVRQGTADLFVMVEPLAGSRHVAVTERRTRLDFAECLRYLVEERYPDVAYIWLVVDNLNTHVPAALYEAFPPQRARALLERLEFHYTPKHGSWPNMAEIEISVFERGCLSHHVPDTSTLEQRVSALEAERNDRRATIKWQFTNPRRASSSRNSTPLSKLESTDSELQLTLSFTGGR